MSFEKRRCGECGQKKFRLQNVKGSFHTPWKDYPVIFVITDLELYRCQNCGNEAIRGKSDGQKIDEAVRKSITIMINRFVEVIIRKTKTKKNILAEAIGKNPAYLSQLLSGEKLPSYSVWNQLKDIAVNPDHLDGLKPDYNFNETEFFKEELGA